MQLEKTKSKNTINKKRIKAGAHVQQGQNKSKNKVNEEAHWSRSTCGPGEHPEQEYNEYQSTTGEKVHIDKEHYNYKSTSEQERTASKSSHSAGASLSCKRADFCMNFPPLGS